MTEQELRQLVRGVIAEQVRLRADTIAPMEQARLQPGTTLAGPPDPTVIPLHAIRHHASHGLFVIPAQGDQCVIEPAVTCNHCGYCKSYGH
jgi:hypothetical protein